MPLYQLVMLLVNRKNLDFKVTDIGMINNSKFTRIDF